MFNTPGWSAYRYGCKAPASRVYVPGRDPDAIFPAGPARAALASRVEEVLTWSPQSRFSRFEHEAATRTGLRSALCLDGYGWQRSDNEAASLIEEAFRAMGAVRPTWEQGQPEHTAASGICLGCGGPLDDDAFERGERLCSVECAKRHRARVTMPLLDRQRNSILNEAARLVARAKRPQLHCKLCGKAFVYRGGGGGSARGHKKGEEQPYCSSQCADIGRMKELPTIICANPACGKHFRVRSLGQATTKRFCSRECYTKAGITLRPLCECSTCGTLFAKRSNSGGRFCSKTCAEWWGRTIRKNITPKRLAPPVFDYFVGRHGVPDVMSAAKFDRLMVESGARILCKSGVS
jgi:hypothetical protein